MFSNFRQLLYHFLFEDNAFILGARSRVCSMNRQIELPLQNNVTFLWRNGIIFVHELSRWKFRVRIAASFAFYMIEVVNNEEGCP